ncbi:MAG: peptide chain release factor-like protein [Planctomycetes bacterium]|nr:peptide chain release factor-like protein [Planctomycetota bacterium]
MAQAEKRCTNRELRARLDYDDAKLIAECDVHRYRASGPGGQHRNKVASAIRLRHRPSDLTVIATESRLQGQNRARALHRLRAAIALVARLPAPERIAWPESVDVAQQRLRVNEKNPAIHHVIALVLDAFAQSEGRLAEAAKTLGVTSSGLTRFLKDHPKAWREVGRIRQEAGLPPLKP